MNWPPWKKQPLTPGEQYVQEWVREQRARQKAVLKEARAPLGSRVAVWVDAIVTLAAVFGIYLGWWQVVGPQKGTVVAFFIVVWSAIRLDSVVRRRE